MKTGKEEMVGVNLNRPANLVLEDLLSSDIPIFIQTRKDNGTTGYKLKTRKKIAKHIPALYYIIHVLLERKHADIETERSMYDKDYIRLYSRDIQPIKSKNDFKMLWEILVNLKVIDYCDEIKPDEYREKAKAYYFILKKDYDACEVIEHQVFFKKSVVEKIDKKWSKTPANFKKVDISKSLNKHLTHQYDALHSINFDSQTALTHIRKLLDSGSLNINQYNTCLISINNILNRRINVSHSSVCNRFFTPITSLSKTLRPFVKDNDGNSLIEIDFSSFNAYAVYKILNTVEPQYDSNAMKIAYESELDLYRRILSGGDFYNDFKEIFFPDKELTRDEIKEIVLKHWFNARLNSGNKYRKELKKRLPRITEIIDSLKQEDYKNFSHVTMKMESELVNDIIYKKFVEKHPDAIMYTIFDSFLVEKKYASELQTMMTDEGSKYFKINCIVKAKKL